MQQQIHERLIGLSRVSLDCNQDKIYNLSFKEIKRLLITKDFS